MTKFVLLPLVLAIGVSAMADNWPSRPIKLVVPYSPGGITDDLARSVGDPLSAMLGVPVVYEYKPGISGISGANFVAKSKPDGYTFVMISNAVSTASLTNPNLPFKVFEDFTPVSLITKSPAVIVTHSKLPINSFDDFIAYAQKNPAKINYATSGIGSLTHLAMENIQQLTDTKMTHVPYKGQSDIWSDFLGGHLDALVDTPAGITRYLSYKSVRILGITASSRLTSFLPDVPTLSETQLKKFEAYGGFLIMGPAGLPKEVVDTVSKNLSEIVNSATFKNKFEPKGMVSIGSTAQEASDFMKNDFVKWKSISDKIH